MYNVFYKHYLKSLVRGRIILDNTTNEERYPYFFIVFYSLIFMSLAVFGIFMPIYLNNLGYNNTEIGTLLSLGSFVALFAQPLWGVASDRSKTKNDVLKTLLLLSSLTILLFRISGNFYYIFAVMAIYSFFQSPIIPVSDAITLEYMVATRWKYGPIRLAGTFGYAGIAVLAGLFINKDINSIFYLCFAIGFITFLTAFKMPRIKGHQSTGHKLSIFELFKNRELMLLMGFSVAVQATLSFYNAFFSIYYKDMGADNTILGWAVFIAAVSEIFFLLFGDRVIARYGIKLTLFGAAFVAVVRWALLGVVNNIYIVLVLQVLHGFIFIVLAYSMATYINREVPRELKASGQTLNAVIGLGFARIIGSIGGGMLSDRVGIRQVFLWGSLTIVVSICVFAAIFIITAKTNRPMIK